MKTLSLATAIVLLGSFINVDGSGPEWDDLRVTWGANIFTNFKSQPRTIYEASKQGFKLVGPKSCD
ncbi:hypothetical protein PoB_002925700, partial [Plakobranchus ocellatus]